MAIVHPHNLRNPDAGFQRPYGLRITLKVGDPFRKLLAGLGYALSPLALAALWASTFGLWIVFVAVSAAFLLCYMAVRANMSSDPIPLMGVTVSMLLSCANWLMTK